MSRFKKLTHTVYECKPQVDVTDTMLCFARNTVIVF
jgi:hypothetical protein